MEYMANKQYYIELTPSQLRKLKMISLLELATKEKVS
jgi:hypothetical protein